MSQPDALSLEGTVIAVAADRGHSFSKPTRDRIVLLEGHGVECDAHAGPFVGHLIWPTRGCRPYASGPDVALARSDAKGQGGSGGKPRTSRTGPNERL